MEQQYQELILSPWIALGIIFGAILLIILSTYLVKWSVEHSDQYGQFDL